MVSYLTKQFTQALHKERFRFFLYISSKCLYTKYKLIVVPHTADSASPCHLSVCWQETRRSIIVVYSIAPVLFLATSVVFLYTLYAEKSEPSLIFLIHFMMLEVIYGECCGLRVIVLCLYEKYLFKRVFIKLTKYLHRHSGLS